MQKINSKNRIAIVNSKKKAKKKFLKISKSSETPSNNLYITFNFTKLANFKNSFIFFFINKFIFNKYNRKYIKKLSLPFYYFPL